MKLLAVFALSFLCQPHHISNKENTCTYAATCITNELDCAINYSYCWGNGAWEKNCLSPGASTTHWYIYPDGKFSSPELGIKFDCDLSNSIRYGKYRLERYQSLTRDCCDARKYAFQKPNSYSNFFDLYSLPN
jgi:hypothetical protein